MIAKPLILVVDDDASQRRLIEFWLQEVGREVNTVGSKSQNPALSRLTVAIKGELEKMREQVQNVE